MKRDVFSRACCSIATLAFALGIARGARADDARQVRLEVRTCPSIVKAEVRRLVGIEIGDLLVEEDGPAPVDADRMTIRCDGEHARIEASGAADARPLSRTISLLDFPSDAAPRALALAAIEVLAALSPAVRQRLEVRQSSQAGASARGTDPPAPRPAVAKPREATPAPKPGPPKPKLEADAPAYFRVGAAGAYRWFSGLGVAAEGGKLNFDREFAKNWDLCFDLEAFGESKDVPFGRARAALGSLGAFVGFGGPGKWGDLVVGGRVGAAHLDGDPHGAAGVTGAHVLRPWAGVAINLRAFVNSGPLSLELSAEAGTALWGARGLAGGAEELGASGPWLGLSVGPGFRFRRYGSRPRRGGRWGEPSTRPR